MMEESIMFDMLDVAIGLAFLYLIMSLIASAVAELIESLLRYRARDLERGIREFVRDPKLVEEIYNHPLVNGLFKGQYDANHKGRLPSYIPSNMFVLALLDAVESVPKPAGAEAPVATPPSPGAVSHWFSEAKRSFYDENPGATANTATLEKVKQGLETLKKSAGNDVAAQRAAIEKWFDASMDRVSGWYKHRTSRNLLIIGLIAAAWLNVDSIKVTRQLMVNKPVRDAIVASASTYVKAGAPSSTTDAQKQLKDATTQLQKLGLPLGWNADPRDSFCTATWWAIIAKLLGIFMTAAAVSLGAPFWFDTLNKFMVVRSTVKPEEKSGKEGSKDPKASK
jgi:hypothetical protein